MSTRSEWYDRVFSSPAVATAVFCFGILSCTGLGVALVATLADRGSASISVTGVSTQRIKSDLAQWSFTIRNKAMGRTAGAFTHQKNLKSAVKFLQANGIPKDEIDVKVLYVSPAEEYNRKTGVTQRNGWTYNQEVIVTSDDVDKVADISVKASALIEQGVDARFSSPKFTYTKIDDKRIEMLSAATENAKQRASAIAKQGNQSLGRMVSVGTATFQITSPGSSSAGTGGVYDTSTIDKEINAVMSADFRLK